MNTRDCLRSYLFETLIPQPDESPPSDDADLFELGLDSLRVMRLLVFIEQELGVSVPDHEVTPERIASIHALTQLVDDVNKTNE